MEKEKIALVSCVSKKLDHSAVAGDMYLSVWFKYAREYAERNFNEWFILSAKHGLLRTDQVISPYNVFIGDLSANERRQWAINTARSVSDIVTSDIEISIFAGKKYRQYLVPALIFSDFSVTVPLEGLGIGQQLKWFKEKKDEQNY